MSKKMLFILVAFFALILFGCTNTPKVPEGGEGEQEQTGIADEEFNAAFETISNYFKENIPYLVENDINLETEYKSLNATIEWSSSNEDIISFSGVTNIPKDLGTEVTLTYTVTIEDKVKEGEIKVVAIPCSIKEIADKFSKQFSYYITRDYKKVTTSYYDIFTIYSFDLLYL